MGGVLEMDQLEACRILGVAEGSSEEEIKEAYRKCTSITHPEEDPEGFVRIQQAYRYLTGKHRTVSSFTVSAPIPETPHVPAEEPEDSSYFEEISEKADAAYIRRTQQEEELDELRSLIKYGGKIHDPEHVRELLEKYTLSYDQYTHLQRQITQQDRKAVRRDHPCHPLLELLREKRGIRPLSVIELAVLAIAAFLTFEMQRIGSLQEAVWTAVMNAGIIVLFRELRRIILPEPALMIFAVLMFSAGVVTIVMEHEASEYAGFYMMAVGFILVIIAAVQLVLFAIRSMRQRKHSSIF